MCWEWEYLKYVVQMAAIFGRARPPLRPQQDRGGAHAKE